MSKRFGRNQRRKMREQVVQLTASRDLHVSRTVAAQHEAGELRSRLERWARDVRDLMGDDSAFNEQVKRMAVEDLDRFGGMLQLRPIEMLSPVTRRPGSVPVTTVETIIRALIWRLRLSRDEFRPMVRIELENRYAEPVGYAVRPEHRWTERDVEYLSRRIAGEMTELLNKGPRR